MTEPTAGASSSDSVIEEKKLGEKASWELPEDDTATSGADSVPTNYNRNLESYIKPTFEVEKSPGRLG
ncbi:hypothetical protein [Paenibacillus flagellatus]|uniref:Uncharacterized protein n=1 Tax=Paenibacillus flagellatus TaxID=2211139 RepID=A0A2V5KNQ7_9BACL|nr:hypothetical protein [Paenibacillus flagellatus]PYI50026.1 hypothetical protein DLM86_31070 [Paenibacillus flagellatus]